jgi:hypothetical protein|tara:strand:- start:1468 stop:2427 length:960 start_codon:yes stop_codon:yes gene_type:complete
MQPKYPIYIISKGRADSRLTVKTLDDMGAMYRVVIEQSEYDDYAAVINPNRLLVLPENFREDPRWAHRCEATGLLGGSIPVRNWVWEHSINEGHKRHWILDDNIHNFYRLHNNRKTKMTTPTCFRTCEDFTDRYTDVKMSGMNYAFFCPAATRRPPYYHNTRVYSCILLSNDIYPEISWRGKFNEDTDLSLKVMKAGYHTLLFNHALCGKVATLTMKGGNTKEIYNIDQAGTKHTRGGEDYDGRREFVESLQAQHPDHVKITQKWGRWHHHIDYTVFQHIKPTKKPDLNIPKGSNNYGMRLVKLKHADILDEQEELNVE